MLKSLKGWLAAWVVLGFVAAIDCGAQGEDWPNRKSIGVALSQGRGGLGCPVVVNYVWPKSPAGGAGIQAGDRLLAVDQTLVANTDQAAQLIREGGSERTLELWRAGKSYEVPVVPERMDDILGRVGKKITPQGLIVPMEATESELQMALNFNAERILERVFPLHIPLTESVYAAGFEVLLLRDPQEAMVGGIEEGHATQAGLRWGDLILKIDGRSVQEKTAQELEALLSANEPRRVRMTVGRLRETKTIEFNLERVSEILRRNRRQLVEGQLVPLGLAKEDLPCFLRQEQGNP